MQLIQAFVRNPVKVAVGVLLVALFGVIGFLRMPKQLTPEVEIPKISIETRWPGASPQEVEREIVQEQEEFLQSVEGVTKMSATCADSMGTITLEFAVGTDLSEALLKVNARLQQVPEYPEEADQPVISTSDPRANAIAWFILRPRVPTTSAIVEFQQQHADLAQLLEPARMAQSTGLRARRLEMLAQAHPEIVDQIQPLLPPDIDVSELGRFAEDFIEARFERVRGVSNANAYGGREEEMQVIVDPEELAARHLTILGIRNALRQQNRDISGGDLWEGKAALCDSHVGAFHVTGSSGRHHLVGRGCPGLSARRGRDPLRLQETDCDREEFWHRLPGHQLRARNRSQRAGDDGWLARSSCRTESRSTQTTWVGAGAIL
jgi:HAE1 family hydrophobic/amphiphilic exporter-1